MAATRKLPKELDPSGKGTEVLGVGVEFGFGRPEEETALVELLDRAMLGPGTNNRAFPRVYYLLEVTCRTKQELKAILQDVGEGGVGVTVDRALERDEAVSVEFRRARAAGSLSLQGWVVSTEPAPGSPGNHRVGVRFGRLSKDERAELKAFLAALYRR